MLLEYMNRINDNKFRNFLCRIFKKKYKESKEEDGNKSILEDVPKHYSSA